MGSRIAAAAAAAAMRPRTTVRFATARQYIEAVKVLLSSSLSQKTYNEWSLERRREDTTRANINILIAM